MIETKNENDSSRNRIENKDENTMWRSGLYRHFFTPFFFYACIDHFILDFLDCKTEIASGTDAQPGYEVAALPGDWGSFTNEQNRAGITWALLAN